METFALVIKFTTLRLVLAVAACLDIEMLQLDIRTAYLHGDVKEELYMQQLEGYEESGLEDLVCRLQKSIYGLKQSGRNWNEKLHATLTKMGFVRPSAYPNLYVLRKESKYALLLVYVDDIVVALNSPALLKVVQGLLEAQFKLSDVSKPKYCLGLEIVRNRQTKTVRITQKRYLLDNLERFNLSAAHPTGTALTSGFKLSQTQSTSTPQEEKQMSNVPYKQVVGTPIYLAYLTRPDIAYAVHVVSQFMVGFGREYWRQVKRIFTYLHGTTYYGITYKGTAAEGMRLVGYSDSDWAADMDSRESVAALGLVKRIRASA